MPWLPELQDHCQTAADVLEQRRHIMNMRLKSRMVEQPKGWVKGPSGWSRAKEESAMPRSRPLSVIERKSQDILNFVSSHFGVPLSLVTSTSRAWECLTPRHAAAYLLKHALKLSYRDVSRVLNRTDTVIVSSIRRSEILLENDPHHTICVAIRAGLKKFAADVELIESPLEPPPPVAPSHERIAEIEESIEKLLPEIQKIRPYNRQFQCNTASVTPRGRIHKIVCLTARYFGIGLDIMRGDRRTSHIVHARHVAMYLCCTCTTRSMNEIGTILNKDHSTILNGCRRIRGHIDGGNQEVINDVAAVREALETGEVKPKVMPTIGVINLYKYRGTYSAEEMVKIRDLWLAGEGYAGIAKVLGRTESSIETKIRKMRLKTSVTTPRGSPWMPGDVELLRKYVMEGLTNREIGQILNRSTFSVETKVNRVGLHRGLKRSVLPNPTVAPSPPVLHTGT